MKNLLQLPRDCGRKFGRNQENLESGQIIDNPIRIYSLRTPISRGLLRFLRPPLQAL